MACPAKSLTVCSPGVFAGAPVPGSTHTRLVNGSSFCSGRVEVFHNGEWGTVCDDNWSLVDAKVVCREVGCGQELSALSRAAFGQGSGPIWLDEVTCAGLEAALSQCWDGSWGSHNCNHREDAGVECTGISSLLPHQGWHPGYHRFFWLVWGFFCWVCCGFFLREGWRKEQKTFEMVLDVDVPIAALPTEAGRIP